MSNGRGPKIWYDGNLYTIRKKINKENGVKFAYWDCAHAGCKVTAKTPSMDSVDGFEYGHTKNHNHENITCGEMVRMEMAEKGKLRAATQTEPIGKILYDLEEEYLTKENFASAK